MGDERLYEKALNNWELAKKASADAPDMYQVISLYKALDEIERAERHLAVVRECLTED